MSKIRPDVPLPDPPLPPDTGSCDFSEEISLSGVRNPPLASVRTGDTLDVGLVDSAGVYSSVVCRTVPSHQVLGSITAFPGLTRLIRCLKDGVSYKGLVKSVRGSEVIVLLRRVGL
ncbi:hypothetical protein [Azospirillum brasilense]|uniref:hypothetical protein n=1 Tax=Azospirillum brasilense TaxID=192 RepID=UPI0010C0D1C8|nr:hypothetical protein [Azospirillum brasilense]